jgi:uncharacterized protein
MKYSKHNIFSKVKDSENFFIVNLLTGNADILGVEEAARFEIINRGEIPEDKDFREELTEKGYLIDGSEETRLYRNRYLDFIDSREKDEIQLFFVTNYSCNFACTYCYQDQYGNPDRELNNEVIDAFFNYVRTEFAGRKKYLTIFGGEPLLNSPKQKGLITQMLNKARESGLEISIVQGTFVKYRLLSMAPSQYIIVAVF